MPVPTKKTFIFFHLYQLGGSTVPSLGSSTPNGSPPSIGWRAIWVHPPAGAAAGAFDVATAAGPKAAAGSKVVPEAEVAKVAEAAGRVGRDGVFWEESQSPSQGSL